MWLSSLYKNGKDTEGTQNYEWDDIIDHMSVGETVGTEEDLHELLAAFEKIGIYVPCQLEFEFQCLNKILISIKMSYPIFYILGLKVILDFIPNHTSNDHLWFKQSCNKTTNTENFYVWKKKSEINDWVRNIFTNV